MDPMERTFKEIIGRLTRELFEAGTDVDRETAHEALEKARVAVEAGDLDEALRQTNRAHYAIHGGRDG